MTKVPIPDIQTFFKYGLDRDIPPLAQPPTYTSQGAVMTYPSVELGPGKRKQILTDHKLGLPEWNAESMRMMPYGNETIGEFHAYQFMEHLSCDAAIWVLKEMQRCLVPGGVINLVMPYYSSAHMAQALDHKTFWSEETWHWLFGNEYYDDFAFDWRIDVHTCFIMGIVERNIDLFTQLVKRKIADG